MKKNKNKQNDPEKKDDLEEYKDVTVADMNVEGMRWYKNEEELERSKEMDSLKINKSERRAMMKGAFAAMLPMFFIGLAIFCAAFGLLVLFLYLNSH